VVSLWGRSFRPVEDLGVLKVGIILEVERDENQIVHLSNGDNLSVCKCRSFASGDEPGALRCVPFGCTLIIRKDRHRRCHDISQVFLNRSAFARMRQALAAEPEFVPHQRCHRKFVLMTPEQHKDLVIWLGAKGLGDDVSVEQVSGTHHFTPRPGDLSRAT
jgi:hypothetical protein